MLLSIMIENSIKNTFIILKFTIPLHQSYEMAAIF